MKYKKFDFRVLADNEVTHDSCQFYFHHTSEKLSFKVDKIFANDSIDLVTGEDYSKIFTDEYVAPICYTVSIRNCLIGPSAIGMARYWPVFFEDNYSFNFLNNTAKKKYVEQGVFNSVVDDIIDFDPKTVNPIIFTEPCVWLYTFLNLDHLIRETLPSILMLREMDVDFNKLKFIISDVSGTGIFDILVALGIPADNIIQINNQWMQFNKVYIPCFPSFGHLHTPSIFYKKTASFLKNSVLKSSSDIKRPKRIFVSRERAFMRRLLNEKSLHKGLIQREFEIIDPGSLSKLDQIAFFSNAEVIVGQHGMGIANACFAQEGCKLLEIMHTNLNKVSYYRTIQQLQGSYAAYYSTPLDLKYALETDCFGDLLIERQKFFQFLDNFI